MSKGFSKEDSDADDMMMDLYRGRHNTHYEPEHATVQPLRCYHSHPAIPLGKGVLYGGNCQTPAVKDCDIYIALDGYTHARHARFPWDPPAKIIEFAYPITDMAAPRDSVSFMKMIDWMCNQLHSGKKIHVGCMGGHGRTGTVLAAVVSKMNHEKDAITWVREHYCERAVESSEQVRFLNHHFGITKVRGCKEHSGHGGQQTNKGFGSGMNWNPTPSITAGHPKQRNLFKQSAPQLGNPTGQFSGSKRTFKPVASARLIW